jgi:hypothetical protein
LLHRATELVGEQPPEITLDQEHSKTDKQWIADPQGVPWETFFTYGESTVYGQGSRGKLRKANEARCCVPAEDLTPEPATACCCAR